MEDVRIPRWPFLMLAGVVGVAAACAGAGLGWLAAALYRMDVADPHASPAGRAGMVCGAGAALAAALAWCVAMSLLARRSIRRAPSAFSPGKLVFVGLVLGAAAGAAGTAILHAALPTVISAAKSEAALWFLGMLVGVPAGGLGGLVAALGYVAVVMAYRPRQPQASVDTQA